MSDLSIARRYARALSERAAELDRTERLDDDVAVIAGGLESSRELVSFFASPVISRSKKIDVVRALFSERVDEVTLQFLEMLVHKRREHLFPDVVRAYRQLRDDEMGRMTVSARVAKPLGDEETEALLNALAKMTGKDIRLETVVDENLLGGIVVRVGDVVYDGSVVNQLAELRERLEKGSHLNN